MNIDLFRTNVEKLSAKLADTIWSVNGVTLVVSTIYVDGWFGGYCASFTDGSWGRVATLLERGKQIN